MMVPQIFGIDTLKFFDIQDTRLSESEFTHVIIGAGQFSKNRSKLKMISPDKVCVFVNDPANFRNIYDYGYKRIFFVTALDEITVDKLLAAEKTPPDEIEAQYNLLRHKGFEMKYGKALTAARSLTLFLDMFENGDPDADEVRCFLDEKRSTILEHIQGIQELSGIYSELKSVLDLRADNITMHKSIAELKEKLVKYEDGIDLGNIFDHPEYLRIADELNQKIDELKSSDDELERIQSENSSLNERYHELEKKYDEETSKHDSIFSELSIQLKNTQSQLATYKTEVNRLKDDKSSIEQKYTDASSRVQTGAEQYKELEDMNTRLSDENQGLKTELARLQALLSVSSTATQDALKNREIVLDVQSQLVENSTKATTNEYYKKQMPIIDEKFMIKAKRVVLIKEVKTAIYMNTLLDSLNNSLRNATRKAARSYLIVVLDTLMDDFRRKKYEKQDFHINEGVKNVRTKAGPAKRVCVINRFDIAFLKDELKIHDVDYLFIVDRLGLSEPAAVKLKANLTEIYLIDSEKDCDDFGLKHSSKNKIIFGQGAGGDYYARIDLEESGNLASSNDSDRQFALESQGITKIILNEIGY